MARRASCTLVCSLLLTGCAAGAVATRLADGSLAPCPPAPHCVSSLDAGPRAIEPLRFAGSAAQAQAALVRALRAHPRTRIRHEEPGYVHAEVQSLVFRFVDDVQLRFAGGAGPQTVIEVRSSSRVGHYDFGVNRARVERLRRALREAAPAPRIGILGMPARYVRFGLQMPDYGGEADGAIGIGDR